MDIYRGTMRTIVNYPDKHLVAKTSWGWFFSQWCSRIWGEIDQQNQWYAWPKLGNRSKKLPGSGLIQERWMSEGKCQPWECLGFTGKTQKHISPTAQAFSPTTNVVGQCPRRCNRYPSNLGLFQTIFAIFYRFHGWCIDVMQYSALLQKTHVHENSKIQSVEVLTNFLGGVRKLYFQQWPLYVSLWDSGYEMLWICCHVNPGLKYVNIPSLVGARSPNWQEMIMKMCIGIY